MSNKYQSFFNEAYDKFSEAVTTYIKDGDYIVDLGCNNGNAEVEISKTKKNCSIKAVDIDTKELNVLRGRIFENNEVHVYEQDANEFIKNLEDSSVDVLLIHTTLHEINTPANQKEYLDWFFLEAARILKPAGIIIIGDLYYHPNVSNSDIEAYRQHQLEVINHADLPEKFIFPDMLESVAKTHNFSTEHSEELRAVKEIDRRYYLFIFKKQ